MDTFRRRQSISAPLSYTAQGSRQLAGMLSTIPRPSPASRPDVRLGLHSVMTAFNAPPSHPYNEMISHKERVRREEEWRTTDKRSLTLFDRESTAALLPKIINCTLKKVHLPRTRPTLGANLTYPSHTSHTRSYVLYSTGSTPRSGLRDAQAPRTSYPLLARLTKRSPPQAPTVQRPCVSYTPGLRLIHGVRGTEVTGCGFGGVAHCQLTSPSRLPVLHRRRANQTTASEDSEDIA